MYDIFIKTVYGTQGGDVPDFFTTNTSHVNEKFSQMSTYSYVDFLNNFRIDCMYTIFGNGDTDDLAEAQLWYLSGVTFQLTSVDDLVATPRFNLGQNYPNPFNPSTTIRFIIPVRQLVTLKFTMC